MTDEHSIGLGHSRAQQCGKGDDEPKASAYPMFGKHRCGFQASVAAPVQWPSPGVSPPPSPRLRTASPHAQQVRHLTPKSRRLSLGALLDPGPYAKHRLPSVDGSGRRPMSPGVRCH